LSDETLSPAALEERISTLAQLVDKLAAAVQKIDDQTYQTAADAFDRDPPVPRVAGYPETAEELKSIRHALDAWLER
jgi:hypothetical protein